MRGKHNLMVLSIMHKYDYAFMILRSQCPMRGEQNKFQGEKSLSPLLPKYTPHEHFMEEKRERNYEKRYLRNTGFLLFSFF